MKYELMILAKPLTNEDVRDKVLSKIEKKIISEKGSFKVVEFSGKRLLAYPVKKFKEGVYILCRVEISAEKATELKKIISLTPEVLRFLLLKEENL